MARTTYVVVVDLEEYELTRLDEAYWGRDDSDAAPERPTDLTLSLSRALQSPGFGRNAIVVDWATNCVVAFGWVQRERGRVQTDLDRVVKLIGLWWVPQPIEVKAILKAMPNFHKARVRLAMQSRQGGELTEGAARKVDSFIEGHLGPDFWENVEIPSEGQLRAATSPEVTQETIDAVTTALAFTGMSARQKLTTEFGSEDPGLETIEKRLAKEFTPTEASLIEADLRHFPDMHARQRNHGVFSFTDGERRLTVWNVNTHKVETAIGVDLVYYNATYRSYVVVQYKRSGDGDVLAPLDERLDSQLDRMMRLEELAPDPSISAAADTAPEEYRLGGCAFVKFVNARENATVLNQILIGSYAPARLLVKLRDSGQLKGDRGGKSITKKNVGRRLLDSMIFPRLVAEGWVGTVGVAPGLKSLIDAAAEENRRVVLAVGETQSSG